MAIFRITLGYRSSYDRKKTSGFSLVELLIIMGLSLIFLLGTSSLFYLSLKSASKASLAAQGKSLSEEGMEAMVAIRDSGGSQWDWTATPSNTTGSEYYQPFLSGATWTLGGKSTVNPAPSLAPPYQSFTRKVTIEAIQRAVGCGSTICPIVTSGGIIDSNTKKVSIDVSWQESDGVHTASISSYLTHWR